MKDGILTEEAAYFAIDMWYGHDEIFKIIARGLVKTHLAKGLDLDLNFLYDMVRLDKDWCSKKEA